MLLLLLFLSHCYPPIVSRLTYSLNATALDGLWHRAAVMALLRLQAKSLITERNLSTIEQIVFKECEREAQKVVEMAKCVTKLLGRRENFDAKEKGEEQRKAPNWAETEADEQKKPKPREEPEFLLQRLFRVMKQALGGGEGTFGMDEGGTTAQDKAKLRLTDKGEELLQHEKKNTIYTAKKFLSMERIGRKRRDAFGRRFVHVDNLHQLQRFWEMRRFCEDYLAGIAERNADFMRSRLPFPVKLGVNNLLDEKITKAKVLMDNISNQLTEFVRKVAKRKKGHVWRRLSIISPRLFSVALSSTRDESPSKNDLIESLLLSPRLFSLSPNDGLFALPDIFNNQKVMGEQRWMDAILALSGAGKAIRKALDRLEEEKKRLEEKVFPMVLDLERRDKRWRDLLDEEQKRSMEQRGFAFLTKGQAKLVYGSAEVV
uniref:Uncharacterized protein n=1 Tax=Globodera rostochiensis TaxID=31243 RepID=A0A914H227_GLORO